MKIRLAAFDIDGTLTVDRDTAVLHLGAINSLRKLDESGIVVVLVSSNALPIVVGLKKYLGLRGPAIGETGALIYYDPGTIVSTTKHTAKQALLDALNEFKEYVYETWQNMFRYHDYALKIKPEHKRRDREIYEMIKEYLEKKYPYIKVGYSGYAIHLTPRDTGKGKALLHIMEKLGISPNEALGVGDSHMDWEFIKITKYKAAVSNADPELLEKVDIKLSKPSGEGVVELVEKILKKININKPQR